MGIKNRIWIFCKWRHARPLRVWIAAVILLFGGLAFCAPVMEAWADRVNQEDCANGYVLDGFPRTIPQAEALDKALAELGQKMDYAINVEVPDDNIVNRMSGRRACVDCGATYHMVYAPTEKEGICDKCGGGLILRDDDKPETVKKRLGVYHDQTQPLIDYYTEAGILKEVDGTIDINDVFAEIVKILG